MKRVFQKKCKASQKDNLIMRVEQVLSYTIKADDGKYWPEFINILELSHFGCC